MVDIGKAFDAIAAARMDFITVQAAAAQGILAPLPYQENVCFVHFLFIYLFIFIMGKNIQTFCSPPNSRKWPI